MNKIWKLLVALVILVGLGTGGYFGYKYLDSQRAAQELADLQTVVAQRGNLTATVGATGTVRSNQTAVLTWQTSGVVNEILVEVGELVVRDQVLAHLDPTSLSQNVILAQADLVNAQQALEDLDISEYEIAQAKYQVVVAQDNLNNSQDRLGNLGRPARQVDIDVAEGTVLLAKIQLDKAEKDYKPWEKKPEENSIRAALYNKLVAAQKNYDSAVLRLNNLKGQGINEEDLLLAEADLAWMQANLNEAHRKLDELLAGIDPKDVQALETRIEAAQAILNLKRLAAPFAGTITDVTILAGDQVSPGKAAFRMDDLSRLVVDVMISEVDINRVSIGQPTQLSFDAILGREYNGTVVEVARVGTTTQGLVEFKVTVELTDADDAVRPGMTAAVNIVINQQQDVLLVPNRAVRVVNEQRVVYILVNGEMEPVEVVLGASSELYSEVKEGNLKVGDTIVLNPPTEFETDGPPPFVRQ